jgi:hypothetical protein
MVNLPTNSPKGLLKNLRAKLAALVQQSRTNATRSKRATLSVAFVLDSSIADS